MSTPSGDAFANHLHTLLSYDSESGQFRWRTVPAACKRIRPGDVAGTVNSHGYIVITVAGRKLRAHRLAWLFVHGAWPVAEIDHRNGNRADNRIDNLRDVSQLVNNQNRRRANANNKTGLLGVTQTRGGRFMSTICVDGQKRYLGTFDHPQAAHEVFVLTKAAVHEGSTL